MYVAVHERNPLSPFLFMAVSSLVFLMFLSNAPRSSHATTPSSTQTWKDWYVSTYAGQWVGGRTTRLSGVFNLDNLENSYIYTLSVGKEVAHPVEPIFIDIEAQIGRHTGLQDNLELVGVVVARWETFPWDHELDTSFSVGEGLSWANEVPDLEAKGNRGSAQLLNYLLFEVAVSPWERKRWEGFFRIHHRSGVFGTFSGVFGASNFLGFGIRFRN